MLILKTTGLTKKYGGKPAVKDADVTLRAGRIYGLLGPNGSGKSTFMKMAAGLVRPTSGTVEVMGRPLEPGCRSHIHYMPTEPYFYDYMTIREVGRFHRDFYGDFDGESYERGLAEMGLSPGLKMTQLSSGMAAKLKLAVAFARRARLVMLDEPLNGIDLIARDTVMNAIIRKAGDDNAILISSHLIDVMETLLDHVLFIRDGAVVLEGDAEEVRAAHGKSITDLYKEVFAS